MNEPAVWPVLFLMGSVAFYPLVLFVLVTLFGFNMVSAWEMLGVPAMSIPFADLLNVAVGIDCVEVGRDPAIDSSCDPFGRVFIYPPLWLGAGKIGLSSVTLNLFAVAMAVAFFLAALAVFRAQTNGQTILYMACLGSPPVWLGVERANTDLFLFTLLVAALYLWNTRSPVGKAFSTVLAGLGGGLKIFPIFIWPIYCRFPRRNLFYLLAFISLFTLLVAGDWEAIRRGIANDAVKESYAFGAAVVFNRAASMFGHHNLFYLARWGAVVLVGSFVLYLLYRQKDDLYQLVMKTDEELQNDFFLCGGLIYVGLFLTTTAYDYKLVFLFLTLPQLVLWAQGIGIPNGVRVIARLMVASTLCLFWTSSTIFFDSRLIKGGVFLFNEALSWCVAIGLAFLVSGCVLGRLVKLIGIEERYFRKRL